MNKDISNKITMAISFFTKLYGFERSSEVSPSAIIETINAIRTQINNDIITEETLKELEGEIIPNMNSVFGKEVAFYKCKAVLKSINLSLLSSIRIFIEEYKSTCKEIKNKNIILDNLYDVLNKYIEKVEPLKELVSSSFENKEKFLNTCNSCLNRHYRGLLNLDNSPVKLGKVLEKIMNSVFDPEGPNKGRNIIQENSLTKFLDLTKYYADREVLQKTNLKGVIDYDQTKIQKELNELPRLQDYNLDGIVAFIRLAGNSVQVSEQSDPQSNAITWLTLANMMRTSYQKGIEIFNSSIKPRLGMVGDMDFKEINIVVDRLEELYKVNDVSGDIEKYCTLLLSSIVGYDLFLKLELYDILSFITGTEYLTFTFIIIYMMFESNRLDNKMAGE